MGKKHCFGKKCKTIAEISDITELKVEKPLDVFLIARMRGGNDVTLCRESSKKIKEPTYYDHMAPVINALFERNPSIVINRESAHNNRKAEEAAPDNEENEGRE